MGQYQQWLYHREVDQQLRTRQELFTQELQRLQEQVAQLEDGVSLADNPILQAIAVRATVLRVPEQVAMKQNTFAGDTEQPGVSPALFAWSRLPNLDTQEIPATSPIPHEPEAPVTPHPEGTLLPENMAAFIDTHEQTIQRLHIPNLVQRAEEKALPDAEPDDRIGHSIQRWRERWGRQITTLPYATTDQQEPGEDTVK